jgi:heat shock protein HtpX
MLNTLDKVHDIFKTTLLLTGMTVLLVLVGGLLGGRSGMIVALAISVTTNFVGYWFSDKIVLRAYGAREVSPSAAPALHEIVRELSLKADIPVPRLYIIESDTPNAFATGRNPENAAIAVTSGIMRVCNREELKGVLAHELSHIKNRDILVSSIAATLAGAVMVLCSLLRWDMLFGLGSNRGGDDRGLLHYMSFLILAPIAAALIQLTISRVREYKADEGGAILIQDPIALAVALRKLAVFNRRDPFDANASTAHLFIVNPLTEGVLMRLFSTHPPIDDRVRRLEKMALRMSA